MSTILDTIAAHAVTRVAEDKLQHPLAELQELCQTLGPGNGGLFYQAIQRPGLSFICEVKKASPSKGLIDPVFDYRSIARDYAAAGADAISCLTEPKWFLGSDQIFREIRAEIQTPMLRKDFVVDEYQIWQARCLGADCVLLICSLLSTQEIARFLELAERLGLAALVEAHDGEEIRSALTAGARMVGVNNRNLKDFSVDFGNAAALRDQIPPEVLYVAESGVKTPADAAEVRRFGADAVLIGETLMRSPDKAAALAALREAAA